MIPLKNLLFSFITLKMLCTFGHAAEKHHVTISLIEGVPTGKIVKKILTDAYRSIKIHPKFHTNHYKAGIFLTEKGKLQGLGQGELGLLIEFKNLVVVPTPIQVIEIIAFSNMKEKRFVNLKDLKTYSIGHPIFFPTLAKETIGLTTVESYFYDQLFKMLSLGKVQIILAGKFDGINLIEKLKLQNVFYHDEVLLKIPLYHFLHKDYKDLVGPLDDFLKTRKVESLKNI